MEHDPSPAMEDGSTCPEVIIIRNSPISQPVQCKPVLYIKSSWTVNGLTVPEAHLAELDRHR
ncbi:hypothetical protein T265_10640 [Opisthorchis viverrini]|uniref:Uncharacterized protein n=1 Tax=Opisthorchis viverrini TaxID=6198 RepID=A0A074Z1I5_OPIVI|nr:hypothetical protein T265_10640 [Opisthorchis viverrini]KER20916.1 hypothetical protein T265_10640 [Opisthorchis viverrini]